MCFYFLGFLRLLSDPPSSIFPLNQLAFNNYHGGGVGIKDISIFFFPEKLKCHHSLGGGGGGGVDNFVLGSSLPAPALKHPEAKFLPFYQQGINFCSEPQNIFIDKNTSSL